MYIYSTDKLLMKKIIFAIIGLKMSKKNHIINLKMSFSPKESKVKMEPPAIHTKKLLEKIET